LLGIRDVSLNGLTTDLSSKGRGLLLSRVVADDDGGSRSCQLQHDRTTDSA
jgi:hypothetical protein